MKFGAMVGWKGASLIALAVVLTPALAAPQKRAAPSKHSYSFSGRGTGSFTPAVADPRLAAAFARRDPGAGTFRFTPATAAMNKTKAVRVAVRARTGTVTRTARMTDATPAAAVAAAPSTAAAISPTVYNLGVAVGWKRFALSGDLASVQKGIVPGERKSAEVGVAYSGKKAGGRLKVAAERVEGSQRLVGPDATYSVDLGASYSIARNLDVTGGVRYKVEQERLQPTADRRRDSQAVYVGTAFRF